MGWRGHATLKCHTCKARRALGGTRKIGDRAPAKRSGWRMVKGLASFYVWLCPSCARRRGVV
jgi:hypothetical protein